VTISIVETCLLKIEHEFLPYQCKQNQLTGHAAGLQSGREQTPVVMKQCEGSHNLRPGLHLLASTQSASVVHVAAAWCDAMSAANTVINADSFMSI